MRKEVRRPRISTNRNGVPLVARMPSIRVSQYQSADLHLVARDDVGNPVDLTEYGVASDSISDPAAASLRVRFTESVRRDGYTDVEAVPVDPENGEVHIQMTGESTANSGVFLAQLQVVDDEDNITFTYKFYISIDPAPGSCMSGQPTEAEIRLHLRDSQPDENFLIDELDFDAAELALAISRPVMYWNEIPPPVTQYDSTNFPFRYHWLEGIVANLFLMAAEHYRRNFLAHSAGGIQVADMNKEQNYLQEGMRRWEEYKVWVRGKKAEINIAGGFGSMGGYYPY